MLSITCTQRMELTSLLFESTSICHFLGNKIRGPLNINSN
uniref:Uncharacterized protein n=1 Tax=Arundo donax TaxID=35708 RepID=A0A0A9CBC3_ARUDO